MYSGTLIRSGNNAKTIKGDKLSIYETAIMYLAPSTQSGMGNVCPMAMLAKCEKPCLFTAGRAGLFSSIINARIAKTRRYFADSAAFMAELVADLERSPIVLRKALYGVQWKAELARRERNRTNDSALDGIGSLQ